MNYYGLSALNDQEYNLKLAFPYNELLWFIQKNVGENAEVIMFPYNELLWFIGIFFDFCYSVLYVSVQRIVMVYLKFGIYCNYKGFRYVSVQRIVMVYLVKKAKAYVYLLGFRTTNCYGLSKKQTYKTSKEIVFPYNELLWFIFA